MRRIVAGIDLGGTAINYTLLDAHSREFLVPGLAEQPARAQEGADVCLGEIAAGLTRIAGAYGVDPQSILAVGLDTPGPASAAGVLSARGSTNFAHPSWRGFDLRGGLEERLKRPVTYLNDGNAAALWGHMALFGSAPESPHRESARGPPRRRIRCVPRPRVHRRRGRRQGRCR